MESYFGFVKEIHVKESNTIIENNKRWQRHMGRCKQILSRGPNITIT